LGYNGTGIFRMPNFSGDSLIFRITCNKTKSNLCRFGTGANCGIRNHGGVSFLHNAGYSKCLLVLLGFHVHRRGGFLRFSNSPRKNPQEAVIGLTYAIAAAISILVIDKAPHGAEHIKELLTGSILWVKWQTIEKAAIVYALVGLFHFVFRKKFILISEHPEEAYKQGISVRFWDFLFYVSFGIVITHSVGTAGVLLVFVFLVAPAITSMMITNILWKQLLIGWTMGLFVTVTGLYISYIADLPSGPTVVSFYGVVLTLISIALYLFRAKDKRDAFLKTGMGIGVTLLVVFGIYLMGKAFQKSTTHSHAHENKVLFKDSAISKFKKLNSEDLQKYLANFSNADSLEEFFDTETDKYRRFEIAQRIARLSLKKGISKMLILLEDNSQPFVNQEIADTIKALTKLNFKYDALENTAQNKKALKKIKEWIKDME